MDALLKVTGDDYSQDEPNFSTLPSLTTGELALLDKLCSLLPPTGDLPKQLEKLKAGMKEPILVLFDLGGTVCYRCGPGDINDVRANYVLRKHYHFFRPRSADLISKVIQHPRAKVAFYTSITRQNALPLVEAFFKHDKGLESHKSKLFALFDQEYNLPDPAGEKAWSTRRDLGKVFDHPSCKKAGFDRSNTILVDSDAFKVRKDWQNSLVVPAYSKEDVEEARTDRTK